MTYGTPTTRHHPRTTGEAFRDASYADPIYRPHAADRNGWGGVVLAVALGLLGAGFLFLWLSC